MVAQQADQPERDNDKAPHDREAQMHDVCLLIHAVIMAPTENAA